MRKSIVVPVLIAALALASCQSQQSGLTAADRVSTYTSTSAVTAPTSAAATSVVPNVVGMRLSIAETQLSAAGFGKVVPTDATAMNRVVINPQNWIVQSQTPTAATKTDTSTPITLIVSKPSDGAGDTASAPGVVPNVVCKDLQAAQDTLQTAGFFNLASVDGTDQGRVQIIDRNWVVIKQSAAAGSRPDPQERIALTVVKFGEPTGSSGCGS